MDKQKTAYASCYKLWGSEIFHEQSQGGGFPGSASAMVVYSGFQPSCVVLAAHSTGLQVSNGSSDRGSMCFFTSPQLFTAHALLWALHTLDTPYPWLIRAPGEDIRQSHISSSHTNSNSESPSPGCKGRLYPPQEQGVLHLQGKHRPTRSLPQDRVSCKDGRDNSNGAFLFLLKSWMNWRRKTVRRQLNSLQSALKHTMFLILSIKSCRGS